MQLNALHMRFGAIATGVVMVIMYYACFGSAMEKPIIQIEFGMDPDRFEGAQVEIDGEIVGTLKRHGQATRSGFQVEKGTHSVRVIVPGIPCEVVQVPAEIPGLAAMVMIDYQEQTDENGNWVGGITLR